ncbi:MAG: TIGR04255 family protein [Pseudoclavibacter sp.]|nr:TIGR04255 family protein [Pseudoclavibacter sp.]
MSAREIYPSAPIVLVAIEVRHSLIEPLDRKQTKDVSALIGGLLPLPSEMTVASITVSTGPDGQPVQHQATTRIPRWTSRDKRTALSIHPDSLVIETTDYGSYDRMRALLGAALTARYEAAPPAGVERIGLRYIDEIRVPAESGSGMPAWEQWVDPSLLGPRHIGAGSGLEPVVNEGVFVFSGGEDRALVLRYGVQSDYAVQSTPELRRPLPPPGPLFKLDIDSFWQAADEVPEFNVERILGQTDALHEPVRGVFESVITDRLREEVLRHG